MQDLGSSLKWEHKEMRDTTPLSVKIGASYQLPMTIVSAELDTKHGTNIHLGGELLILNPLIIRVGMNTIAGPWKSIVDFTAGVGIKMTEDVQFDFAMVGLNHDLGNSYRVSLKAQF